MKTNEKDITLFVVEDDASIRFGLEEVLSAEGFQVVSCESGDDALPGIAEALPDLILLDVMLPGKSGYEICRELRSKGCRVPILMLTAKGQEMDKVIGLNSGADDYVTKPFGLNELIARVKALLRRTRNWEEVSGGVLPDETKTLTIGAAEIDVENYAVSQAGESHPLTPRELELILFLHQNRGKVLSRDRILEEVWGVQYWGTTRTLDQCVAQIRKKIGDQGRTPSHLLTVHGVGYKLIDPAE